jgi:hypothetical protein
MTVPARSDRWTFCAAGHIHWGARGAAGLLLRHIPWRGSRCTCSLSVRRSADDGGTWGIPAAPSTAANLERQRLAGSPGHRQGDLACLCLLRHRGPAADGQDER